MSLKATIESHGGISKNGQNFTGSCTTIEFGSGIKGREKNKIIIDAGMFQGEDTMKYNKALNKSLVNADTLIATHAHTDHIGRIPFLVRKGFKGNIIMTSNTLWQAKLQWEDYIKLTTREIEKVKHRNNKLAKSLNDALQIVKHSKIVQNKIGGLKKITGSKVFLQKQEANFYQELQKQYQQIRDFLAGKDITIVRKNGGFFCKQGDQILTNEDIQDLLASQNLPFEVLDIIITANHQAANYLMVSQSETLLQQHKVSTPEDIAGCLEEVPKLLYNITDIDQTLEQVKILEIGETLELYEHMPIMSIDDPRVMKLPEMIHQGYNTPIEVDAKIKAFLLKKYRILMQEYTQRMQEIEEKKIEIASLKVHLLEVYQKVEGLKLQTFRDLSEDETSQIQAGEKILQLNKIHSIQDIDDMSADSDILPYNYDDLKKAMNLLKGVFIDPNVDTLKKVSLSFYDAGHIEGSVQVVLSATISQVHQLLNRKQNTHIMKKSDKEFNFLFSGDLGKRKDPNLSGTPDTSIEKSLDFVQVESTYAGRIHTPKKESIEQLFKELSLASGKVLIPVFSMQRTQEILMEFLKEKKKKLKDYKDELWIIKKEKKDRQRQLLHEQDKQKQKILTEEIQTFSQRQKYLEGLMFDSKIYVDSPLAEAITKGYYQNIGEKYAPLSPKGQKEMFQEEIIQFVARGTTDDDSGKMQFEKLYLDENKDKRDVILASGGMLQGGPVLSHLKEILGNSKAKIVFVGYCPPYTLGGKLKAGEKKVNIDGENYDVKCQIVSIDGFSGHGDEEDILTYVDDLPLKKGSVVSFNHGDEKRIAFARKADQIFEYIQKDVSTLVPRLGEKIEISLRSK